MEFDAADYRRQVRQTEEENRKRLELETGLLHTELKQVIGFLQHQDEGEGLKRYVEENRKVFCRLSRAGALFLAAAAKGTRLLKGLNKKEEDWKMRLITHFPIGLCDEASQSP